MENEGNVIIGDQSALHALMHRDWGVRFDEMRVATDPLRSCASTIAGLRSFNIDNPLYGDRPVSLLVPGGANRRFTKDISCRYAPEGLPPGSFVVLRDGLFMASPELAYLRMATFCNEMQLAVIATDLCGRYFIADAVDELPQRSAFLTTPDDLCRYCKGLPGVRGSKKALDALRWTKPNSGSPMETRAMILFSVPLGRGGLSLPFSCMNYDVKAGRLANVTEQGTYSLDIANPDLKKAIEYDGTAFHQDASADKRRRNELKALGWDVFPLDSAVLEDPDRTVKFAKIVAEHLGARLRMSSAWQKKYLKLRQDLGLCV